MKNGSLMAGLLLPSLLLIGCGRGGGPLLVGEIKGPSAIDEGASTEYRLEASGDTGITCQWAIDPASAGEFTAQQGTVVNFTASDVASDLEAEIRAVVSSDNAGPILRSRKVTIRNVPANDIELGEIKGPGLIVEEAPATYSVEATGSDWFSYQWSCIPPEAGVFDSPTGDSTDFTATRTESGYWREIEITVSVTSESGGTVDKSRQITVVKWGDVDAYLGGGHPLEGVTYRRNNRSGYRLPLTLDAGEKIEPPYEVQQNWPYKRWEVFHELVVAGDERLYLGAYISVPGAWYSIADQGYGMWSFHFTDGEVGPKVGGGMRAVATCGGVTTIDRRFSEDPVGGHGDYSGWTSHTSSLVRYGTWPEELARVSGIWGGIFVDGWYNTGDWDSRRFADLLPLPDDSTIAAFSLGDYDPPTFLQRLSESLDILAEAELGGGITGLAFDGNTQALYVACDAGLYCYGWDLTERWNTASTVPMFSADSPVITDDGGIIGLRVGTLRRVEPDGTSGGEVSFGGYLRPALLNDGTIAVIDDSSVVFFDPELVQIGSIPLPSDPGSGGSYTRPPLVDAADNMALFAGPDLYIISGDGTLIDQRTFESDIREVRLGPSHLFVALDYEIFRFPS